MARTYVAYNGAMPTTAAFSPIATGAIKTLLQIAPPSTMDMVVIQWGISFDGTVANTPVKAELIETDVAATVTAHIAAGVMPWSDPNAPASNVTLGVSATGFTASAEGTTTASRVFAAPQLPPTQPYDYQFPLGREPRVRQGRFLRVRVTAGTAVNALCYVIWEE